jgi:hypothetical protein
LEISESHLAVRTVDRRPLTGDSPADAPALSPRAHQALRNFDPEWRVPTAGVEVLRTATAAERDEARIVLKEEPAVQSPDASSSIRFRSGRFSTPRTFS